MSDYIYGINPVHEALKEGERDPIELLVQQGGQGQRLDKIIQLAQSRAVKVTFVKRRDLQKIAGHERHQGVLLKIPPFAYQDFDQLIAEWRLAGDHALFLILDGITDPHNFGAILRSAELAGCRGVIVAKDRSCPVTPVVEKTASGALSHLPLCQVVNLARTIDEMKKLGIWCYGLAGETAAESLFATNLSGNIALIVGSEGSGLRTNIRSHCDALIRIPMRGRVGSLNASVAAGIALFEVVRQNLR